MSAAREDKESIGDEASDLTCSPNDTPANHATNAASSDRAATGANLATDVVNELCNKAKNEVKLTGAVPKKSAMVSRTPIKCAPSTTRSGLVRKDPITKRPRASASNKTKSASEKQHVTWQILPPQTCAAATTTNAEKTNSLTSHMNTLTIAGSANNNYTQQRSIISSINNSFLPAASSSIILDRQPYNVAGSIGASSSFKNNVLNHQTSTGSLEQPAAQQFCSSAVKANHIFYNASSANASALPPNPALTFNPASHIATSFNANSHAYNNSFIHSHSNINSQFAPNLSNFSTHYHSPFTSYNTQLPSFNTNETAADITLSNSQIAARHAISKDLPYFSGKPEDWPIFITNYIQSTERCGFTDQENLIRLQKSLKGSALDAVKGKLMMPDTVKLAIETLRMLYGRPEIIHQALQRNLKNEPTVRKERLDTLINFALAVQNYRTTMQAMGLSDYLNDPMLLQELVEKLPADLKLDWGRYRISLHKVDIALFDTWLFSLATCASQVTTYSPYIGETKNANKERILVHDVFNEGRSSAQTPSCLKCHDNHRLFECPEFTALSVNERWNFIRTHNLCLRCFKKHHIKRCNSKRQCGVDECKMPHNTLLHKQNQSRQQQQNQSNSNTQAILFHAEDKVLFKYIPVTLSANGYALNAFALIDEGASCSLIDSELAEQLGLDGPTDELCLQWTGEITQKEDHSKRVSLFISDRKQTSKLLLNNVRTITKLNLPVQTLTQSQINKYEYLKHLPITPYIAAKAKILIGLDNAKLCVPLEVREDAGNGLIATRCRIGWGVHGRHSAGANIQQRVLHVCSCNANYSGLDEMLKHYFSLESVGVKLNQNPLRSKEDQRAKEIMESTTKYLSDKKCWETGLLWKYDKIFLPDSLHMAKRRLACLESKMQRNERIKTFHIQKMQDYEKLGYVKKLKTSEIHNDNESWYIPIFTVENKKKGKTRIVWDAAASVENISLNSVLLKGPDLLKSLVGILIRFRERPVAICGDIREMFHQIRVRKDDQRFQQFLWRGGDTSKPIEVYVMTVMTFGASCSPSLANYIKNRNAERFVKEHPAAVQAILNNTFVDDWLQSVDTEEEMIELAIVVRAIHQDGGFEMRNWLSNSKEVLKSLEKISENSQKFFVDQESKFEKVLGMWWNPSNDMLTFFENFDANLLDESMHPTKRAVLRVVMTIFDPLGLLGNFVVYGKILLQQIWRSGVKWDERINVTECEKWWQWIQVLKNISTVNVPRCYPLVSKSKNVELHIFMDASIDAYAAVAYLRADYAGQTTCSLVASKTRVAPLKPISVPKMELMAAVLGLRLSKFCCSESSLKINRRWFWSDSKDVLYWINSDARKFQQFVAVRIGEILEESDVSEWRWVPSSQNVADEATKWKSTPDLNNNSRWFNGPPFLRCEAGAWPNSDLFPHSSSKELLCYATLKIPKLTFPLITAEPTRFSRWEKLRGCQMAILKFLRNMLGACKVSPNFKPFIENPAVDAAEFLLFKMCQEEAYYEDIEELIKGNNLSKKSNLYKLAPYLDEFGLLRIKGRIDAINSVPFSVKRPIILPQKHVTTNLLINYYHRKYHHQHNEIIVNEMRQRFWIFGLRSVVRSIAKSCQYCKIRRATPEAPVMGNLPAERLACFTRPFYYTGIDYFGPIDIVVGRRREKRWGVVFTCMTVRAVHLEIAPSLSTDSFLLVLKQFICRRGTPRKILSDNATNFRGASRILIEEVERISSSEIERKFPTIEWKFIPPASPHMGGAWERLVRSVKSILMDILPSRSLREEQLRAALADVENVLNSRPLTYVPLESTNGEALTPNHFLIGSSSGLRENGKPEKSGSVLSKHFRVTNMIANEFWKRWLREYLPCLTRRTKWHDNPSYQIAIGDIVIIVDDNAKRNEWLKGVVVDVHRGKDESVRSAVVKTQHGLSTRPVVKLAKLDVKA